MKINIKNAIASALAAVTLTVPFNCVTASAASIPDPNGSEITAMNYYVSDYSFSFEAHPDVPDTTYSFYCSGGTIYASFGNTQYGNATVKLYHANLGYTGSNFVMPSSYIPGQVVLLNANLGSGYYYFIITTTSQYGTKGGFSVGHYQ